jgi:peptidoglycan hydrolase-like protein with peptidoglycan-binding domain
MTYGYYDGAIDGIVGPKTRAALLRFQEDFGLKITGTITPEVLDALRVTAK